MLSRVPAIPDTLHPSVPSAPTSVPTQARTCSRAALGLFPLLRQHVDRDVNPGHDLLAALANKRMSALTALHIGEEFFKSR